MQDIELLIRQIAVETEYNLLNLMYTYKMTSVEQLGLINLFEEELGSRLERMEEAIEENEEE